MHQNWRFLLLLVLLASPVELRRGSSGGGGSNRGQSQSRGQLGQGGVNQGGQNVNQGGSRPNNPSGNFHPNQQQQPHNFGQQPNNIRGPNTFHGSAPVPKTSSNTFGKALLGGAAGALGAIVVYEGAKAIIKSASEPFNYQGRNYYWDQNYKGNPNMIQCSMPLNQLQKDINKEVASTTAAPATNETSADATTIAPASSTPSVSQSIGNLQFADGSRPRDITWGCRKNVEQCCGTDCCPVPPPPNSSQSRGGSSIATILLVVLLVILIGGCCCCFIAYKMCRSAFDCIFPREHKYDDGYQQNADYNQPQSQYPMQQYPQQQQQQYPQQQPFAPQYPNQYAPQQGYPSAYPPHPTY